MAVRNGWKIKNTTTPTVSRSKKKKWALNDRSCIINNVKLKYQNEKLKSK
jgi:hypothetical protein